MDRSLDSIVQLEQLSQYVSYFIEGNVSAELLAALYQSQLAKKKQDCFLNPDRFYNRLVRKIIAEGQKKHEIREDISVEELAHHVLLLERGIIMDWCVQNGSFSLGYFGSRKAKRLGIRYQKINISLQKGWKAPETGTFVSFAGFSIMIRLCGSRFL